MGRKTFSHKGFNYNKWGNIMETEGMLIKEKWNEILHFLKIEFKIGEAAFTAFIQPMEIFSFENGYLTISVKKDDRSTEELAKNYINQRYIEGIQVSIETITNINISKDNIRIECLSDLSNETVKNPVTSKKQENKSFYRSLLNEKFTFNTFVVAGNNTFAHAACLAVAESPGQTYNPLFIYGGVGLGKTHLMESIGNYLLDQNPNKKVLYVTSETFTNEVIEAIKKSDMINFRNKYREVDVLLIDDIQFISQKEATQEEFFHTFNTIREANKQIVITSDRPPMELKTLEERLTSRFASGLLVDIQSPTYEARMAILHRKCELENPEFLKGSQKEEYEKILDYIASNIQSNVRELEGALTKIQAAAKFNRVNITLDFAKEKLKDIILSSEKKVITIDLIINIVADYFNITVEDILSNKKSNNIALPRQIAMYLCKKLTNHTQDEIGQNIGGRDHSTVIYACKKIDKDVLENPQMKLDIDKLIQLINPE